MDDKKIAQLLAYSNMHCYNFSVCLFKLIDDTLILQGFRAEGVKVMKPGIHPEYKRAIVICSCGNRFETGSVKEELRVEICSECHPFYTGRQKFVDTGGRVDRFKKKYNLN